MNSFSKLYYLCKEIGIPNLMEYVGYQFNRRVGRIEKLTPAGGIVPDCSHLKIPERINFPPFNLEINQLSRSLEEEKFILKIADQILDCLYYPFYGNAPLPLDLSLPVSDINHWTHYGDQVAGRDIKWIWEPARFAWAFDLAQAYLISRDEKYSRFFWLKLHEFEQNNPTNFGPNWVSAQEAAIRIITWVMVYKVFQSSESTTIENQALLANLIWQSAARIPPTLNYARSQNNNHHLSEALGLVVAGSLFADQSASAREWLKIGSKEFVSGLLRQIEPDGTYSQHSANYHRLMIQLALVYDFYAREEGRSIPVELRTRLASATTWITAQLDQKSGMLPNLGHNDGALLLPMGCVNYRDYRPTIQVASLAFRGFPALPPGHWDELSHWLNLQPAEKSIVNLFTSSPAIQKIENTQCTVFMRGVRFHGRPAHADQLHADIWWDDINIAQDAGTFSYNKNSPWDNPLSSTIAHNTVTIDNLNQMKRASKFLWLDQAQAKWNETKANVLQASHNGFRNQGVIHTRTVQFVAADEILIADQLDMQKNAGDHDAKIHWLLPDWQWQINGQSISLTDEEHHIELSIHAEDIQSSTIAGAISLIRSGESVFGKLNYPTLGWVSSTYGEKIPALSLIHQFSLSQNLTIITRFKLTKISRSK